MRTARVLLGALLALTVASVPGALPAQAAKKPVVVWVDSSMRAATKALFAAGINGREVRVRARDMSTVAEQLRSVDPADAPDIILIDNSQTAALAAATLIEPLTIPAQTAKGLVPAALDGFRYGFGNYGIPMQRQNLALITNADLVPTAPETFAKLSRTALQLKEAGRITMPFALAQGEKGNAETTYPLFSGLGGFAFGTNAAGSLDPTKVGIDNKQFRGNSTRIDDWRASGLLDSSITAERAREAFVAGQAPFWIASPDDIPTLRTVGFRYRITPVPPVLKRITPAPLLRSWGFAVTPFARQHNVLPAATALVTRVAASAEGQAAFAAASTRIGLPANIAAAARVADRVLVAFGAAGAGAVAYPNIPQWAEAQVALGEAWRDSTRGEGATPAADAFAAAQKRVRALGG
jgi:arabinogalactan oligomer/maltooligosaccharide transport system substrate-binding protein